eukprot:scaffold1499_cov255-Pinguiococcus_pyrenoidosus.AAC.36
MYRGFKRHQTVEDSGEDGTELTAIEIEVRVAPPIFPRNPPECLRRPSPQKPIKPKSHEEQHEAEEREYDRRHRQFSDLGKKNVVLLSEQVRRRGRRTRSDLRERDLALLKRSSTSLSRQEVHEQYESEVDLDDDSYFGRLERHPLSFCCRAYCCLVALGVLMGIIASFGVTVIRVSTDTPMYIREHRAYKRQTALIEGEEIAGAKLDAFGLGFQEREEDEFSLEILYIKGGGGLDDPQILARIKALEEKIIFDREYPDFCTLDYTLGDSVCSTPAFTGLGCRRHTSPLHFFDPAFWLPTYEATDGDNPTVPSLDNYGIFVASKIARSGNGSFGFANPADPSVDFVDLSAGNLDAVIDYWSSYCHLDAANCPPDADTSRTPFAYVEINETASICDGEQIPEENATVANYFWQVVDSSFGLSFTGGSLSKDVRGWRSEIFMGTPRRSGDTLLETEGEDLIDQEEDIGEFLYDFQDDLEDGIGHGVDVYWDGTGMEDLYAAERLTEAFMWVIGSFLFVLFYLTAQTQSAFLAISGMVMILLNFIPAILLYRFLFQIEYFGVLNMLGVFIILGIGVDDIFVFLDTFNATEWQFPWAPFRVRIAETLKVAGKAMSVTSASTALSFLANATSVFPAVYTFGVFCALLVLSNFASVCTVWPRVVAVSQYYIGSETRIYTGYCCPVKSPGSWGYPESDGAAPPEPGHVEVFFRDTFYPWIIDGSAFFGKSGRGKGCGSKVVLAVFSVYILVSIIFAAMLEPDPDLPEFYPDDDNYIKFPDVKAEFFAREDDPNRVFAQIPFGIEGIDQNKCDGGDCDPTDPDDRGTIIWDETIVQYIADEYVQKWFLDFCEDMEFGGNPGFITPQRRKVYEADEFVVRPVRCVWQSFQRWCEDNDCPRTRSDFALSRDDYIVDASAFYEKIEAFLADSQPTDDPDYQSARTNADVWRDYIFVEDVFGTRVLRFIVIEAALTIDTAFDFEQGIDLYEDWENWLSSWKELSTQSIYDFQEGLTFAFVTDAGAFH